jgi:hypothetical protein
VQPLPALAHVFAALSLFLFYAFFRTFSFLNAGDAILWRQAVLLKQKGGLFFFLILFHTFFYSAFA